MSYKGDSPGKAVTRYRLWLNMATTATALGMPYKGAYVLGGEGGDISALLSLGIEPKTITAVDFNEETAEKLKEKYPEITVVHGEAGAFAKDVQFNSVHLDFCGRINAENIITLADIQSQMGEGCVMITLLKGRETSKGTKKNKLWRGIHRQVRRNMLADVKKNRVWETKFDSTKKLLCEHLLSNKDGQDINTKYILKVMTDRYKHIFAPAIGVKTHKVERAGLNSSEVFIKPDGTPGPLGLGAIRLDALRSCAEILLLLRARQKWTTDPNYIPPTANLGTQVSSVVTYHSRTNSDHGTPFVSGLMWQAQWKTIEQKLTNPSFMHKYALYQHFNAKTSLEQLKAIVLSGPNYPASFYAEMFKLKEGTIRAWRAHKTMKTYEKNPSVDPVIKMSRPDTAIINKGHYSGWGRLYIDSESGKTVTVMGDADIKIRKTENDSIIPIRKDISNMFDKVFHISENGEGQKDLSKYLRGLK